MEVGTADSAREHLEQDFAGFWPRDGQIFNLQPITRVDEPARKTAARIAPDLQAYLCPFPFVI